MSKTYTAHLEKAKALFAGLKQNYGEARSLGVQMSDLEALEEAVKEGEKLNDEVETLRARTSEAIAKANARLEAIKAQTAKWKQAVKQNVNIDRWPTFGIPDKR